MKINSFISDFYEWKVACPVINPRVLPTSHQNFDLLMGVHSQNQDWQFCKLTSSSFFPASSWWAGSKVAVSIPITWLGSILLQMTERKPFLLQWMAILTWTRNGANQKRTYLWQCGKSTSCSLRMRVCQLQIGNPRNMAADVYGLLSNTELPHGWESAITSDGRVFFIKWVNCWYKLQFV